LACSGDLDLSFVWRLRRVLLQVSPDIVHCHSRRGADFLGGQAAAMAGIPCVLSRRVDNSEPAIMSALRYRQFARVVAISENIASVLRNSGVGEERLSVIRSAVDVGQMQLTRDRSILEREFGIRPGDIAIAVVAQLIPRKGHRFLFEALAKLPCDSAPVRLVVFGTGVLDDELARLSAAHGLRGVVQFAGYRADLDDYLVNFDMLVHPALREGLGIAMLKAAAAGLPVIAFDVAGAREAVCDEETGLLVAAEDSRALAEAICRLTDDAELRHSLGKKGRTRMQAEFSVEKMADRYIQVYEAVLNA
jgi:glycosyltransferase involved in cell wall biosynthesis